MSLYTWVIIGTLLGPFALSFDKKVHFYSYWKSLFPAIFIVGVLFLIWDEYFTQLGIWGFNAAYLSGIYIGNLPIEEIAFFLVVPYAFVFIYEVIKAYFPKKNILKLAHFFAFAFTLAGLIFGVTHMENWYTASACIISALLTIGFYFVSRKVWYSDFVIAFLLVIAPFLIVNGILTGAFTDEPIVWYNEEHIMGIRIFTIPLEDLFYNYSLLLPIIAVYEFFNKKYNP